MESDHGFVDTTACFTETGHLVFQRPDDIATSEINGVDSLWIRCRIELGNFGTAGSYELDADTWVWKDENPLRPPSLKSLAFKFQEVEHTVQKCLVYNDFVFTDVSTVAAAEYKPFQVFAPVADESPTLYLGWEGAFPNDRCDIFFHLVEIEHRGGRDALLSFEDRAEGYVEQRVAWEYWSGKTWSPLAPKDSTENFTQSGFISFTGPTNQRKSRRFGESLYWMRARLEMGGYVESPRVDAVLLNATFASNVTTFGDTPLGSSQGTPNQFFRFPRGPVLRGEIIMIREKDKPRGDELDALLALHGDNAVLADKDGEGWWVRWSQVSSFYDQGSTDRVYT
ncbi:MAG: hypothetical protein QF464_23490, partial [Myxococcota bacterium]|nr:hypothetical protein [Myxococcota bacterium]